MRTSCVIHSAGYCWCNSTKLLAMIQKWPMAWHAGHVTESAHVPRCHPSRLIRSIPCP
jgi:hypothetical protein